MQAKRITQRQITQQKITPRQMQPPLPRERREFLIPDSTIVEEVPRKIRFSYLRNWIFGLIALILLPVSVMLILVGQEISDHLTQDWEPVPATVDVVFENSMSYTWAFHNKAYTYRAVFDWHYYLMPAINGSVRGQLSLCDLVMPFSFVIPHKSGSEFTIWVDPQSPSSSQCVPITHEAGSMYMLAGWIMLAYSVWILMRLFHRAGLQARKS